MQAANFASQYSAWEPKEFDPNKPSEESAKSNNGYQYDANTGGPLLH